MTKSIAKIIRREMKIRKNISLWYRVRAREWYQHNKKQPLWVQKKSNNTLPLQKQHKE
jgi:hypothetical protein